jgi:hypothetical protein
MSVLIKAQDGAAVEAEISTPRGTLVVIASLRLDREALILYDFHIDGPGPGLIGIAGIRDALRQVMEEYDVGIVEIHGFQRTTGAQPGRTPKAIRFRRR